MASGKNIFNIIFAVVFALCLAYVQATPVPEVADGEVAVPSNPSQREGRFYGLGWGGWGYPHGGMMGMGGSSASASASATSSSMGFGK